MGGQKQYNPGGGFSEYKYHQVGDVIEAGGLSGKVLARNEPGPNNLPYYSNTSNYYFKLASDGTIDQMRVYENRVMVMDFDWGHAHGDIPKGVVHVQVRNADGGNVYTRMMNNAEIKKYGDFLRAANPNVRFR